VTLNSTASDDDSKTDEELLAEEMSALALEDARPPKAATVRFPRPALTSTALLIAAAAVLVARPLAWYLVVPLDAYDAFIAADIVLFLLAGVLGVLGLRRKRLERGRPGFTAVGYVAALVILVMPLNYFIAKLFGPVYHHVLFAGVSPNIPGQAFSFITNVFAPIYGRGLLVIPGLIAWLGVVVALVIVSALGQVRSSSGATSTRLNTLSLIAFIAAFFVGVVGIVLGHLALADIRKKGERGWGFALAALWLGYGAIGVGIVVFALAVGWIASGNSA
jgi:hypothetical protein